jgi:hypothetical protein
MKKETSEKTYRIESYGKTYSVVPEYGEYSNNSALAVSLYIDGEERELFAVVTVNLPMSSKLPRGMQFVDVNNIPDIGEWLESSGLAKPAGFSLRSGFVDYPAYEFNLPGSEK